MGILHFKFMKVIIVNINPTVVAIFFINKNICATPMASSRAVPGLEYQNVSSHTNTYKYCIRNKQLTNNEFYLIKV